MTKNLCEWCGKQFAMRPKWPHQRFCSKHCRRKNENRRGHPKPLPRACRQCGRLFTPARMPLQLYCSATCRGTHWYINNVQKPAPARKCAHCGESFKSRSWVKQFCSKVCQQAAWSKRNQFKIREAGRKHRNVKRPLIPPIYEPCAQCGAVFHVRAANQEYCSLRCRNAAAYEANRERELARVHRRIARKKAVIDRLTQEQIIEKLAVGYCFYCGSEERLTLDHFIPLIRGGATARGNIVIACKACNSSKGTKMPNEYLGQLSMELA